MQEERGGVENRQVRKYPPISVPKVDILVDQTPVPVLLDTGSSLNIIERKMVTGPIRLLRSAVIVSTMAGPDSNRLQEVTDIKFEIGGECFELEFHVVDDMHMFECHGIIGFAAMQIMNLVIDSSSGCAQIKQHLE